MGATLAAAPALVIYEKSFGPDHPKVATVLINLAILDHAGQVAAAVDGLAA